eukprot:CAMPEP_0197533618 /NCGR_PEP_ID=MMETSP1318-20131121/44116_1 /TAXON_ID=552666 /ORGANISM="Partenskyella glossopodia, Strain RCC365" /LENGTH=254 /DNA_ID=CAMNT_0043090573 /DNA_START=621 /DNA_END=1385 /DNA_ORIENTATION=+
MIEKYPSLLIHAKKTLLATILSPYQYYPNLTLHVTWAVGEYLHTEATQADYKVVLEYQRSISKLAESQVRRYRALREDGRTTNNISPPVIVMNLLDRNISARSSSRKQNRGISSLFAKADAEFTIRLIHVSIMALCKLAARCVEIVPSVRGVLITVLASRDVLPESICRRASQCARLLQQPSLAYTFFKQPFYCTPNLSETTSVVLMTNTERESNFLKGLGGSGSYGSVPQPVRHQVQARMQQNQAGAAAEEKR